MLNPHGNHGTTTTAAYLSSALLNDDSIPAALERTYSEIVGDSADTSQMVCVCMGVCGCGCVGVWVWVGGWM